MDNYVLSDCTHFKVENQWFYVSRSVREHFLKIFKPTEAIRLLASNGFRGRGLSAGRVMAYPLPIKIYTAIDILHYLSGSGREEELSKAYSQKRIKEIRATRLIKQVNSI